MPMTDLANAEPINAYCARTSGLQSTFRPTSISTAGRDASVGMNDEMVGRITPSIGLTANIEPTIMAPVEPALAKPLISPLAR